VAQKIEQEVRKNSGVISEIIMAEPEKDEDGDAAAEA
jgi:hypothetical protein